MILNRNYRCGEEIVQVAEDIISYNTKRFEKKMQGQREDAASMVEVRTFKDHYEENKHIIYTVKEEIGKEDTVIPDRDPLSDQVRGQDS